MSEGPDPVTAEAGAVARLVSYVVLLAAAAVLLFESTRIPGSRFEVLGAGAFPQIVYGAMILILASAIASGVRTLPAGALERTCARVPHWIRARRLVVVVFACLGLYLAFLPVIGFRVATFVFLLVLQCALAPRTKTAMATLVALAVVFSFGLDWVFAEVFDVFLPRGL